MRNFYNDEVFRNNIMADLEEEKEYYLGPVNPNASEIIYNTIVNEILKI